MATTRDRLFGGALTLVQPAEGHRAGSDAVLLAACLPEGARAIADLGAASGVVGLRAAQMNPAARVSLFERDPALIALAGANIAANGLAGRVSAVEADILAPGVGGEWREAFDCVLSNPPFHAQGRVRASPEGRRAAAHVMQEGLGGLDAWLRKAAAMTAPRGDIFVIHAAGAIGYLLPAMAKRFGAIRLRFAHPSAGRPAIRVLARGRKGSRAPLAILPPLVLNGEDGAFTPEAEAIHRGTARIALI